jgi:hypothetical protein
MSQSRNKFKPPAPLIPINNNNNVILTTKRRPKTTEAKIENDNNNKIKRGGRVQF